MVVSVHREVNTNGSPIWSRPDRLDHYGVAQPGSDPSLTSHKFILIKYGLAIAATSSLYVAQDEIVRLIDNRRGMPGFSPQALSSTNHADGTF